MIDRPSSRLRHAIMEGDQPPVALVGVHNALLSRLTYRAGFDGGSVSNLEISAARGLPHLVGSLAAGLGNRSSNVDLHIVESSSLPSPSLAHLGREPRRALA